MSEENLRGHPSYVLGGTRDPEMPAVVADCYSSGTAGRAGLWECQPLRRTGTGGVAGNVWDRVHPCLACLLVTAYDSPTYD